MTVRVTKPWPDDQSRRFAAGARPTWIGTSWKMTKTLAQSRAYAESLRAAELPPTVQAFVLPPLTALAAVSALLPASGPVLVGAQNAHWAPDSAWTGEVSMTMVRDAGAQLVEIGHSERREHLGDTDEVVARKMRSALDAGLVPLLCVGESAEIRTAGRHVDHVVAQVRSACAPLTAAEAATVIIAYEPVWAIGARGIPARPEQIAAVMPAIGATAEDLTAGTGCLGVLFGGSVSRANASALLKVPGTDGLFVGRAAWDVEDFLALVALAAASG